ncbi:methyl-accepting chemotaxis protein [Radiobacillus deserti]|uniref:Chemotaxis protein n=1 Tax=Radiobacillus deserti TaxID=2594883 RepID=A0A516KEM4_9BACI|nr:methyl-accepting chemotaxis protein [Radiobacillus deserti]QDP39855.1 chemotaxis protein [Radiobacillus deserti]
MSTDITTYDENVEVEEKKLDPKMEAFMEVAPFLMELFPHDFNLGIADRESLIFGIGCDAVPALPIGYKLHEGDGLYEAVHLNQVQKVVLPSEIFGFPVFGTTMPLHDSKGNVIGAVGVASSLQEYNTLFEIATKLSEAVDQVSATIEEMASSITNSSDNIHNISGQSSTVLDSINEIDKVAKMVREVSERSQILGLNASIEAARAGEYGKGFSVVASEIRKMAENSKNHTDTIRQTASTINGLISNLHDSISQVSGEAEGQSAATEQLAATIQEISDTANELATYAGKILNGYNQN